MGVISLRARESMPETCLIKLGKEVAGKEVCIDI